MQEENRHLRSRSPAPTPPPASGPSPTLSREASPRQQPKYLRSQDVMLQHTSPRRLPGPETAAGRPHILKSGRGRAGSITPPAPSQVCKPVGSSALHLTTGAKGTVGVVAAARLFPGPGAILLFDLFCVFPPLPSECQSSLASLPMHCDTFPKLSGSSLWSSGLGAHESFKNPRAQAIT